MAATSINLGDGNNTQTFDDQDYIITGGDGNNTLTLGNGADQLVLGNGNNVITVGNGAGDAITLGSGTNQVILGSGSGDVVHLAGGNNIVQVAAASLSGDVIQGGLGGDGSGNTLQLTSTGTVVPTNVSGFSKILLADGGSNTLVLTDANFVDLPMNAIDVTDGSGGTVINASAVSAGHNLTLRAGAGNDALTGGAGNDYFGAGTGHATIDGGAGYNTVVFAGTRASYHITDSNGTTIVTGAGTSDTLTNIQQLSFADAVLLRPTQPVLAPTSDSGAVGDNYTNVALPTLTGTGTANATINVYDGQTLIGTGIADGTGAWSVTVTTALNQGVYTLTTTETVGGETSLPSVPLAVTLDSIAPDPVTGLALAPASDGGVQGDNLTNVALATITGTVPAGSATVDLYEGGTLLGTATVVGATSWSITVNQPLHEGANTLIATDTDYAGNVSTGSAPLVVTLDTVAPAATSNPVLDPGSDSDVPGDGITNVVSPTITGTGIAGSVVTLFDGGNAIGTATVQGDGSFAVVPTAPLGLGAHTLTTEQADTAGNLSVASAPLPLTIVPIVHEIMDSAGTVIGTVSGPGPQPGFHTTAMSDGANTFTDTVGSYVTLLNENNILSTNGNDTVSAGAGADTIYAGGGSTSVIGGSGSMLFVGGSGSATVGGGTGSSTIFGGGGGGQIQGGSAGNNVLVGGGGPTTVTGGGTGDVLVAGSGTNTLIMHSGNTAFGSDGQTTVYGASDGTLVGGGGSNTMVAGDGSEALWSGTGTSVLYGGGGANLLAGSASGHATLIAGSGNTTLLGAGGTTEATGGGGDNLFITGAGAMTINEGSGTSQVVFGSGDATVNGGTGTDYYTFVNGAAGGHDLIAGFKPDSDKIVLFGYDQNTVQQTSSGGNTMLTLSDGTSITLVGIDHLAPTAFG